MSGFSIFEDPGIGPFKDAVLHYAKLNLPEYKFVKIGFTKDRRAGRLQILFTFDEFLRFDQHGNSLNEGGSL